LPNIPNSARDFVLNGNIKESKIPEYNSLKDPNLQRYFRNQHVKKTLVKNEIVSKNS